MPKFSEATKEQLSEYGKRGAEKSNEVRRRKKEMREAASAVLSLYLKNGKHHTLDQVKSLEDVKGKNLSAQDMMLLAIVKKAISGDLPSAQFLRDTAGEKPKDEASVNLNLPVLFEGEDSLE